MNELITIVEDEDDIRALVSAGLKKERFRVREYADGKGFLSSLRAEKPDLVVLDVMLPDTDGFAICRGMRADRSLAAIPGDHAHRPGGGSGPGAGPGARRG